MVRCRCAGTPYSLFSRGFGLCDCRNLPPTTILAWESRCLSPTLNPGRRKQYHGQGSGVAQTAHAAAGVFAASQLETLSCRLAAGVYRPVSFTPGDPSFLLRQCRQESVLLPRLWPGRRPDPLCPALPRSAVSPECGTCGTATNVRARFPVTGADGHLLSASTPSPPGSDPLSGAPWIARSRRHRGTRYRLCSRRKFAVSPHCPRLFAGVAARCGSDQQPGSRHLLPTRDLPLPGARPDRQPLRAQYRCCVSAPFAAAIQRGPVCLGVRPPLLQRDSGRRTARLGCAVAGWFSQHDLRNRHPVDTRSVGAACRSTRPLRLHRL